MSALTTRDALANALRDHGVVGASMPPQGIAQTVPELLLTCFTCGHMRASDYHDHLLGLASGAVIDAATLRQRWEDALDTGCPSCGPHIDNCDHIEGYHHALSDLRALMDRSAR